ncbi:PASTA domain-containing protein [Mycobacterium sp. UM_WWY]
MDRVRHKKQHRGPWARSPSSLILGVLVLAGCSAHPASHGQIPNVQRMPSDTAEHILQQAGFAHTRRSYVVSSAVPPDRVVATKPPEGTIASFSDEIVLTISTGPIQTN